MPPPINTRIEKKGKALWVVVDDYVPGWTVRLRLGTGFFRHRVGELRIEPAPIRAVRRGSGGLVVKGRPGREIPNFWITAEMLRKVPLSAPWYIDIPPEKTSFPKPVSTSEMLRQVLEGLAKGRGDAVQRRRITPLELAQLAALYVEKLRNPKSSNMAALAISRELGLPRSTIRNRLHKARTMGLLSGMGMGLAGGELTHKARNLLRMKTDDAQTRRKVSRTKRIPKK